MRDLGKVPWPKLREYLHRVSSCETRSEFMHAACVEVQAIIPFDATAGLFDTSDLRNVAGIGKSEACTAAYNNYYRAKMPISRTCIRDWRNYDDLEFAVDYMFPNGMYKSLGRYLVPGHQIALRIQRSRLSSNFSESDIDILDVLNDHINNIYSSYDKRRDAFDPAFSTDGISTSFRMLSRREAEVCSLVIRRLDTREIAACMLINHRTVEKYMETIFEKLDVHSREQLRWHLGAGPSLCDKIPGDSSEGCSAYATGPSPADAGCPGGGISNRHRDFLGSAVSIEGMANRFPCLSEREVEVCCLVARRLDTREIAMRLNISIRTVEKHVDKVFRKLGVRSRAELRSLSEFRFPS